MSELDPDVALPSRAHTCHRELEHTCKELSHYSMQLMTEHACESHREKDPQEFRNGHIFQAELVAREL